MRLLIQRVTEACVTVEGKVVGQIQKGLLVFAGIEEADSQEDIEWCTHKLLHLRIFNDEEGKMNLDLLQSGGSLLMISQFTLHALVKKGNRPSFIKAANPVFAESFFNDFCSYIQQQFSGPFERGIFGADMKVNLVNDGPVTIWMDSKNRE